MRTTTVPAQITTVEDKIAGELSMTQLILLVAPVFSGAGIFVLLPPFFSYAPYKMVLIVCISVLFAALAIRLKGRLILRWLLIAARYNSRPRYYLFNKKSAHLRNLPKSEAPQAVATKKEPKKVTRSPLPRLSTAELAHVEQLIANPAANLHFKTSKKGALNVYITEVE